MHAIFTNQTVANCTKGYTIAYQASEFVLYSVMGKVVFMRGQRSLQEDRSVYIVVAKGECTVITTATTLSQLELCSK